MSLIHAASHCAEEAPLRGNIHQFVLPASLQYTQQQRTTMMRINVKILSKYPILHDAENDIIFIITRRSADSQLTLKQVLK